MLRSRHGELPETAPPPEHPSVPVRLRQWLWRWRWRWRRQGVQPAQVVPDEVPAPERRRAQPDGATNRGPGGAGGGGGGGGGGGADGQIASVHHVMSEILLPVSDNAVLHRREPGEGGPQGHPGSRSQGAHVLHQGTYTDQVYPRVC